FPDAANDWLDAASQHPGSWWPDWAQWLKSHAGRQIPAPKTRGSREYTPIEDAPGRYVKQRA
ncbi:MAG: class I poly(R)-hydroxyalkanoic acid synthase, partial [Caldimonas sp.]